MMDYSEEKRRIRDQVQERLDFRKDYSDEEVRDLIDEIILDEDARITMSVEKRVRLKEEIFDSLRRLDILQKYVDDSSVTEIMVNGMDCIFVEKNGKLEAVEERFESAEKLQDVIQQIVAGCNRIVNEASPIVDARLSNGSRVNIVNKPIALNGPILTIRRFPEHPIQMADLVRYHSITPEAAAFLETLVKAKYNIFISGGTGSGKTTFLNVLSGFIPEMERVITIEDSAELQLQGIQNLVKLETRNSNVEGCQPITMRDLIRSSLRMRPDRIVVGEVRGAEAIDMLQCLNTGHDGSMSTGHANSAADMMARLENMVLMGVDLPLQAIKQQIASGLDIIVHLGRLRDRSRRVLEIAEVLEYREGEIVMAPLFRFEENRPGDSTLIKPVWDENAWNESARNQEECTGPLQVKTVTNRNSAFGESASHVEGILEGDENGGIKYQTARTVKERERGEVNGSLKQVGVLQNRYKLVSAGFSLTAMGLS